MSSYGLWLSAAGMQTSEHRQNVIANNLANAHTVGFKHDYAVIAQRAAAQQGMSGGSATPAGFAMQAIPGGLQSRQNHVNHAQGALEKTDRPLDMAIDGEGFFVVQHGDEVRYTRDGRFALNGARELVLSMGGGRYRVMDADGLPIVLAGGEAASVSEDGTLHQGDRPVARLAIVAPNKLQALRKKGENLFAAEAEAGEMGPSAARVIGGALEQSTFDPIQGLTSMIEAARAYQMNATLLQMQDHVSQQAVAQVGRLA